MAGKFFVNYVKYLETYRGRDKVIRGASYLSCLIGGHLKNKNNTVLADKFFTIMNELNNCRVILRLFDDSAMMAYALQYGLGKQQNQDKFQRIIQIIEIVIGQAFYPIEHLAWAAEKKLININSGPWLLGALVAWIIALKLAIVRSLWNLWRLNSAHSNRERQSSRRELLNILESSANLMMAVNWLPWTGTLSDTTVGALGLTSTVVSMIKS